MLNTIASIFSRFEIINKKTDTSSKKAMNVKDKYSGKLKDILKDQYKVLFEKSIDAIYLHDLMGNFIDPNPAALDLLGYSKEEVPSINISSLLSEDQSKVAFERLEEIIAKGSLQERD